MDIVIFVVSVFITVMSALMLVSIAFTEFKAERKKPRWYFYVPSFIINSFLGTAVPYVFMYALFNLFDEKTMLSAILVISLYIVLLIGSNTLFIVKFFSNENFSLKFYVSGMLVSLTVAAFWITNILVSISL